LLEAQLKQRIQQRMGEATKVRVFETGEVTWKRSKDGTGAGHGQLLKEQPDLLQTYSVVKPGSTAVSGEACVQSSGLSANFCKPADAPLEVAFFLFN
jgi:hypothetical protein